MNVIPFIGSTNVRKRFVAIDALIISGSALDDVLVIVKSSCFSRFVCMTVLVTDIGTVPFLTDIVRI